MSVDLVVSDAVATATVDNPPVNALDDATLEALGEAARSLAERDDVRAVVLTGAGEKVFMAGADLRALAPVLGTPAMAEHVGLTRPVFDAWRRLPQPVVAALRGNALGGGLELALTCDFLVADPRVRLGTPEVGLGLIPGAGGTQRLPRRVGWTAAMEMLLLGRLVKADRALALGLVNVVSEEGAALEEAQALAARLAALPALAIRAAKESARRGMELGLDEGLDFERSLFLKVASSADAREGAEAFLGKREPRFTHR